MTKTFSVVAILALVGSAAHADVLFNNGGMVTHPGAGAGGADVSQATATHNTAGSNVLQQTTNPWFRVADDFTVTGPGWFVDSIRVHAYQTGSTTTSPFTAGNINVWDGRPGDAGSNIVTSSSTILGTAWTGIYRVFDGVANLTNTQRPVMYIDFDLSGQSLAAGNYWIDFQFSGVASAWAPYVMDAVTGETVFGNGRQMTTDGLPTPGPMWQDLLAAPGAEVPFVVSGTVIPAPGALALLGMGGLLAARRRRM